MNRVLDCTLQMLPKAESQVRCACSHAPAVVILLLSGPPLNLGHRAFERASLMSCLVSWAKLFSGFSFASRKTRNSLAGHTGPPGLPAPAQPHPVDGPAPLSIPGPLSQAVLQMVMPLPESHPPNSCLSVKGHVFQEASSEGLGTLFPHCM